MRLSFCFLLVIIGESLSSGALLSDSAARELLLYRERILLLNSLLASEECGHYITPKQHIDDESRRSALEVAKMVFKHLHEQLVECRESKLKSSTDSPTAAITVENTPTTTGDLTHSNLPLECPYATNLTDWWRLSHNGSDIRPGGAHSRDGYACDFNFNMEWFRFTGNAGSRMLETCPEYRSCGTYYPHWTDEAMPNEVGVISTINTYEVLYDNCKHFTSPVQVMRCSWDTNNDLVYKLANRVTFNCRSAFCGQL